MLTRQLATLIGAGIPLFESLNALIEQVENKALHAAMTNVREQVREGISFAKALEQHPKIFPPLYVNMVRAGEASGTLEAVLAIKKGVQIPEESAAQIQSDSLLGGSYIHIQISGMPENMQPGSKFEYTRGSMDILGILLEAVGGMGGDKGGSSGGGDAGGGSKTEEALP